MSNDETINRFYRAFADLDSETMQACYAPDATFKDEIFELNGAEEIGGMWSMLCETTRKEGQDVWSLTHSQVKADGNRGSAHWDAHYRFSATGKLVTNKVDTVMSFNPEGLITNQHDRFDFWAWSRQALGTTGLLLGWTPIVKGKVQAQANKNLQRYLDQH
ncbi:MAG: nuclear transport factor 2 family protein [Actinobacteria bacterium]|nr:nuclear transport factor 2 family protein [Actinomycetota bacterium]